MEGIELRIPETQRQLPERRQLLLDHSGWIAVYDCLTIALREDGTVAVFGKNEYRTQGWRDIVAVAAGQNFVVGLKANGTLVADGANYDNRCSVTLWTDIIAIAAGMNHTVGLKRDGTVMATGANTHGQCNVDGWHDVIAVAANDRRTVGVTRDGKLLWAGAPLGDYEQEPKSDTGFIWPFAARSATIGGISFGVYGGGSGIGLTQVHANATQLHSIPELYKVYGAVEYQHLIMFANDGDDLASRFGEDWRGVVAVASSALHLVGVKSDGTLVGTGRGSDGECDFQGVRLFTDIHTAIQSRKRRLAAPPAPVFSEELDEESFNRIKAMIDNQMAVQAIPTIQNYIDRDPDDDNAWRLLAVAHRSLGNTDEAISAYKKAADRAPENAEVRMALYSMYSNLGNAEEALYWCDQAIAIRRDPRYCIDRLDPLSFLEGYDVAMEACNQYRQEFPDVEDFAIIHAGLLVRKAESLAVRAPDGSFTFPTPQARTSAQRYLSQADQLAANVKLSDEIEALRQQLRAALHGPSGQPFSHASRTVHGGSPNPAGNTVGGPSGSVYGDPPAPRPDLTLYWIWSAALLLLGGNIFAIVSIYYLIKLSQSYAEYDIALYFPKVKKWCVISSVFTAVSLLFPLMALLSAGT